MRRTKRGGRPRKIGRFGDQTVQVQKAGDVPKKKSHRIGRERETKWGADSIKKDGHGKKIHTMRHRHVGRKEKE